jgi:hypothetical protein
LILVLDNYDSFVWNLVQAFAALGHEVVVRRLGSKETWVTATGELPSDAIALDLSAADVPTPVGVELGPRRTARLNGKRVPREHCSVLKDGVEVGVVTSGTFSPTLDTPIAMAYVDRAHTELNTELMIDIRGRSEPARVVKLPFYRRQK